MRWQIAQFFERLWWRKYILGKDKQEYLSWKRNYWIEFLEKIDRPLDSLKSPVIDIGCGPAGIFINMEEQATVALDPLLNHYEALPIFDRADYGSTEFVEQSFEEYSSKQEFQTVFCLNAINHFKDLKGSFDKLYTITANGGEVIVSIDAHNHTIFRRLFAWLPLDILHPHQYYLEEYEAFLKESGFSMSKKVLIQRAFFFDYWVLLASKNG